MQTLNISGIKQGDQMPSLIFSNLLFDLAPPPSAIASVAIDILRDGVKVARYSSNADELPARDYAITIDSATGFTINAHIPQYPAYDYYYECKIVFSNGEPQTYFGGIWSVARQFTEAAAA